jgi:hypothetical protein
MSQLILYIHANDKSIKSEFSAMNGNYLAPAWGVQLSPEGIWIRKGRGKDFLEHSITEVFSGGHRERRRMGYRLQAHPGRVRPGLQQAGRRQWSCLKRCHRLI